MAAKCTKDEQILSDKRQKNLCIYVGKAESTGGPLKVIKHHFCCFSNILEKTFQEESRKQLSLSFGTGSSPDCRGLTLEELERVDFSKIDFSEVAAELQKKIVRPDQDDIKMRLDRATKQSIKFDHSNQANPENRKSGVNKNFNEEE